MDYACSTADSEEEKESRTAFDELGVGEVPRCEVMQRGTLTDKRSLIALVCCF